MNYKVNILVYFNNKISINIFFITFVQDNNLIIMKKSIITNEAIKAHLAQKHIHLSPTHKQLCLPIINRIYNKDAQRNPV